MFSPFSFAFAAFNFALNKIGGGGAPFWPVCAKKRPLVTNIQKIQHEDILSAFYGKGNYESSKERLNYRVSKGAWLKMSEKDRKDYYKKLITGVKKPKKIVQSSDGEVQLEEAHV